MLGSTDCVGGESVNAGLRLRRAEAARQFLLSSGALPENVGPARIDLMSPARPVTPEPDRALLRSVRLSIEVPSTQGARPTVSNARTTLSHRVVIKSFIRPIGGNTGSIRCPGHPANPAVDPLGLSANLRLRALAGLVDALISETAPTDARDNQYRLYTARDFTVICENGVPASIVGGDIDTDNGRELFLETPELDVYDRINIGGGTAQLRFAWSAKGRPNLAAEPGFQGVCFRSSRYIWHRIEGRVDCSGARVTFLDGSKFPTHRVYVDQTVVGTIPQSPFVNLWYAGSPSDLVR